MLVWRQSDEGPRSLIITKLGEEERRALPLLCFPGVLRNPKTHEGLITRVAAGISIQEIE
jgi:hypothetical protein